MTSTCLLGTYPLYLCYMFFFYSSGAHRDLHSFPTRRSSDLATPSGTGTCPARAPADPVADEVLAIGGQGGTVRSEEQTSELQSPVQLVCRLLLEKKKSDIHTASSTHTRCHVHPPLSFFVLIS